MKSCGRVTKEDAPWNYPFCCGYHVKQARQYMTKEHKKMVRELCG